MSDTLSRLDQLRAAWQARLPLSADELKRLREHWEIVHTYNSNAIEGNTLTLGETKAILIDGITISGKPLREILEATNHKSAMGLLYRLAESKVPVTEPEILDLHRLILNAIRPEDAGRYRTGTIRVGGSRHVFPNPAKVPDLMAEFVAGIAKETGHPVEIAARAHFRFVAIHPFADGNGRTARLLMNLLLMRAGYPPAFLPVERRGEYYDLLEEAHTKGTARFEAFIADCVLESLKDTLAGLGEPDASPAAPAAAAPTKTRPAGTAGRSSRWNEEDLSEGPAVALLEKLGWTFIESETLNSDRDTNRDAILARRLEKSLRRLNPWLSDDNLHRAVRSVTHIPATGLIEANERVHRTLVHTLSLEQDLNDGRGKIGRDVHFIDFANPRNNEFVVTRQFDVQGAKQRRIFDAVCFVNGLPLAIIECKSPTLGEKWFEEAMKSLNCYQEAKDEYAGQGVPKAFEATQVVAALAGSSGAKLATVLTPDRHYAEWREPFPLSREAVAGLVGREVTPQDLLIASALSPENLLDLTSNFVVFEPEGARRVKKLAKYQQFIAVNRALDRIRTAPDPAARGGIVWHTQGSGKSLTMLWLAVKLRRLAALENPSIVIVTDRTDLDTQISETFERCGFPNPQQAKSVRHLAELLGAGSGLTVTTTIQKFQGVSGGKQTALNEASNLFVLVDEAHRTQYKSLAARMRQALPNACFLGFTGTPIDKNDRSTPKVFGPYIHTYPIQQAVEDGATVPIYYEGRLTELHVEGSSLDAVFSRVFADKSDDEKAAIRKKFVTYEAVAGAPSRITRICTDLIDHFEKFIRPNGFKAQVVACTRDAAVTYLETLERLGAPKCAVIMSGTHTDEDRLARHHKSREQQKELIARFINKDDPLSILVVCDMLLTGFDAPVEQVMYLDSPLKEHNLLQAIARVNRTAEGKTYGLVVDYWGISDELQDALAVFDPKDIQGALVEISSELPRLENRHRQVMDLFKKADRKDPEACLRVLEPEDRRAEFEAKFRKFAQSMDMVLPDPAALRFQKDLTWLGKLRVMARARFRDDSLDLSGCGAKVKKLIEEYVRADEVVQLTEPVSIFSKRFDEEVDKLKSPEAKASEMEHAVKHEISVKISEDPVFYQKLSERLEEIIRDRREHRIQAAEAIKRLQLVLDELRGRHQQANSLGLSDEELAFFNALSSPGDTKTLKEDPASYGPKTSVQEQDRAKMAAEIFAMLKDLAVIDWVRKEDVQREMRRQVKRQLRAAGFNDEETEKLTSSLMDLARVRLAK